METNKFTIFEELKEIRESKKITLEEISAESRIQLSYLKAIEAGEFEKIPEVYDKLFFQSYISYLQVEDPDRYLEAFRSLRKETFSPTPTTTMRRLVAKPDDSHSLFNKKNMIIVVPALVILGILLFFALNSRLVDEPEKEKITELPIRQVVKDIEARQNKNTKQKPVVSAKKKDSVHIQLTAVDSTWMRFIIDHRDTSEYLLTKGNIIALNADSLIKGIVGNAGGVQWLVNGKDEGILGHKGDILTTVTIDRSGIRNKKIKRKVILKDTTHATFDTP